jgi:GGDEF domain-containing protein
MISLRKSIDESEQLQLSWRAILKAFLGLTAALPKAALPANPELYERCKEDAERLSGSLRESRGTREVEEASSAAVQQVEAIFCSNRAALEERDSALQDLVASVAVAMRVLKDSGQKHESNLAKAADDFDALSRVDNIVDLRGKLRQYVARLREAAEEIRRDHERTASAFDSRIQEFKKRLEVARKESGIDSLTGLGNRRQAEREVREIPKRGGPACVMLFDIEGFGGINRRYGTPFGDKLLRTFVHQWTDAFAQDEDLLFRWGADEFLAVAPGLVNMRIGKYRTLCGDFASEKRYYAMLDGFGRVPLAAPVAIGGTQYAAGDVVETAYARARTALEEDRKGLHR